jgi:hypothetical protein
MCEAFADLLAPDPAQQYEDVLREYQNLDLAVWIPGRRPLVVENKTFSLPDEEQLQVYSERQWLQDDNPALVLLSLADPGWPKRRWTAKTDGGRRSWSWLPYGDLAGRLRRAARGVDNRFERELLKRYCRLLDDLVELASIVIAIESDGAPARLPEEVLGPLRQSRLGDGLLKLRSKALASRIGPYVETNFTRGEPLLEAWSGGGKRWLAWQLQGDQFRLCATFGDLKGGSRRRQEARSEEARKLADDGTWFDFSKLERMLGPRASKPTGAKPDPNGFNKYNPDFVYRYRLVPDLTVGELTKLGRFYRKAAESASSQLP